MSLHKTIALILATFACCMPALAQKQLLLLKRQTVLLRLEPGDDFVYRLRNSKTRRSTYVNNLLSNAVVTHNDTVFFDEIGRIYFKQNRFYNRLGQRLVIFGAGLFLVDQLNHTVIQGEPFSLDQGVTRLSIGAVGAGLPLMLIKQRSRKLTFRYGLRVIDESSPFYRRRRSGSD